MNKRDKQRNVFIQLVNKQLEPHGVTYEDVKDDPNWYMNYKTSREAEQEFVDWGVNLIREELGLTKVLAEREISWFILQWGLSSSETYEETSEVTVDASRSQDAKPKKNIKR
jgi:hypothetical protein